MRINKNIFDSIYLYCVLYFGGIDSFDLFLIIKKYKPNFKMETLLRDLSRKINSTNDFYGIQQVNEKRFIIYNKELNDVINKVDFIKSLRRSCTSSFALPDFFEDFLKYNFSNASQYKIIYDKELMEDIKLKFDEHFKYFNPTCHKESVGEYVKNVIDELIMKDKYVSDNFRYEELFDILDRNIYTSISEEELEDCFNLQDLIFSLIRPGTKGYSVKELIEIDECYLSKIKNFSEYKKILEEILKKEPEYYDILYKFFFGFLDLKYNDVKIIKQIFIKYRPRLNIEIK